ncbi:MAG: zf-HC2 domain-containing protein [Acidobacteria bacterium]|nr:zf-HC2 domain-containing protein [Acidobacteriota bacterium]
MKCEELTADLVDFLEGALDPPRHRAIERHLEGCSVCRAVVSDLTSIQAAAFTLDRLEPSAHVWTTLQARIAQEGSVPASVLPWRGRVAWRPWLAAAAALLVATAVGVWSLVQPPSVDVAGGGETIPAGELVASVESELQAAEAHYEKAIQGLEQIARSDNEALDPGVATVLQKSLLVIDQAIDESRAAVRSQPSSANAQDSLFDAMRNKVALLQQTVELINEMRKGNQAEAGRIMKGLSQP